MASQAPPAVPTDIGGQLRNRPAAFHQHHPPDGSKDTVQLHIHEQTPLIQRSDEVDDESSSQKSTSENDSRWSRRRPSVFWLFPLLLLYMLGFGGSAVPKINLMVTLSCRDYLTERSKHDTGLTHYPGILAHDSSHCQVPEVQSLVARFQLYYGLVTGLLSAVVSPQMGHLSDRYGRTPIIALSALATVVGEIITVIVAANTEWVPINLLLLGAMLDGLGGSFTAILALSSSYVSDCTTPEKRSVSFGYLHGSIFTGIAAGPFSVAMIMRKTHNVLIVFYSVLVLHTLFTLVVLLLIPESLSWDQKHMAREKHQVQLSQEEEVGWFSFKRWNPKKIITPLSILLPPVGRPGVLFPNRHGASPALRRNIILLSGVDTLHFGMAIGTSQIMILYAEYMFGWGNVEASMLVSIISTVRVINFFVVLPIVTRIFRERPKEAQAISGSSRLDVVLIRISIFLDMLGYAGYALSRYGSFLIASGVVTSLGGMAAPVLQSSLTQHVPRDRVGQILGAKGLLHAVARVIAPSLCSFIYSVTVGTFPKTVFILLSATFGIAFCSTFYIQPHVQLLDDDFSSQNIETNEQEAIDEEILPA